MISYRLPSTRDGIISAVALGASGMIAIGVGWAVGEGLVELAFLGSLGLLGLVVFTRLTFVGWCSLLLVTSVASRGLVTQVGLPPITDFLHYPIALGFAVTAATRPPRAASKAPSKWLWGFVFITLLAAVAHPDDPLRTVLFLVITGEPLLIIWAVARWGPDERSIGRVGVVALVLALIQLPIGVAQGLTLGWSDPVQGTLTGHGAGHHVLGALFSLMLFISFAGIGSGRFSVKRGLMGAAIALFMMLATGSIAITVIAGVAVALGPLLTRRRRGVDLDAVRGGGRLSRFVVAAALGTAALTLSAALLPNIYERALGLLKLDRFPPADMVRERAESDVQALVFGSGPSTSASRAGLLLVVPKEGGPLQLLGVPATRLAEELYHTTLNPYGGSAERVASGLLGVIGDLGLIGLLALIVLLFAMWRRAKTSMSWLAGAGRLALFASSALIFIDNWFEYPEYAVSLSVLLGIVIADQPSKRGAVGINSVAR